MSDITLTVSAPGPTVDLTADAPGAVTVTVESGGGVSSHAALPDLATSGHPASVIAFTPTGSIAATTVQAAVAEVATDAAAAYQPLDSDLTAIAALTTPATTISGAAQKASNLSDLASASSARTNLGLGTAATAAAGSATVVGTGTGLVDALEFVIDGGGSALTTGMKGYLEVPFACTITRATLLADQSGSVVVDVFRSTYSDFAPPTHPVSGDKLTASAPPTISTATKSQDATLTGWTTSLAAGDVLGFNVNSATTITRVTCSLKVTRT